MRWSIRNQILLPILGIQGAAIVAISLATATLAARRGEEQVVARLGAVVDVLRHANFPFTRNVLERMKGLSGAEFVAYDLEGRIAETSLSRRDALPATRDGLTRVADLDAFGESPRLAIGGQSYLAALLPPPVGSRGGHLLILYPEASWRQARRHAATPPLVLGGIALLIMMAVTGWIAVWIGRRIRALGDQVARIAGGDFEGIDPGPHRDEVADLVRSIDAMCIQLSEMRQAIRLSERTRLLAQLAAGLAHQLRNSLTGARMSLQLHGRRCSEAGRDQSLNVALRQLSMTEEQVKGLLSLGRVEDRPPVRCALGKLLGEIALLVGPACEHVKVAFEVENRDDSPEVTAEEPALRAAVLNMTLNAIEAAGRDGSVWLSATLEGGEARIEVRDTGPGPPPDLADSLFEPFATSKPEGVGLGLALAHEVARRHGGKLSWDRPGGLTRFVLTLPAMEVEPIA